MVSLGELIKNIGKNNVLCTLLEIQTMIMNN